MGKVRGQYESLLEEIEAVEKGVAATKAELGLQEGKKSAVESELNKAKAQFERKTNLLRETAVSPDDNSRDERCPQGSVKVVRSTSRTAATSSPGISFRALRRTSSDAPLLQNSLPWTRQVGFNPPRDRTFFFGGVERDRRGGWLSIAPRKIRLMRVW